MTKSRLGLIISRSTTPVFRRQTPERHGQWENWVFHENSPAPDTVYDALVIYNNPPLPVTVRVRGGAAILVTAEPPSVLRYPENYLAQFNVVISSQIDLAHRYVITSATCLPWHIGLQKNEGLDHDTNNVAPIDYDFLVKLVRPRKSRRISLISSAKTITDGHRQRLKFARSLKEELGDVIELFGAGVRHVEDKWEALWPYEYHIAIENCSIPDYWTEKLTDSLLAWSYPLYYGCTNLAEYMPAGAWRKININDIDGSIKVINEIVENGLSDQEITAMSRARARVLDTYNLIPFLSRLLNKDPRITSLIDGPIKTVHVDRFEPHYGDPTPPLLQRLNNRAKRLIGLD